MVPSAIKACKYLFAGSKPRLCSGGLCALVLTSGLCWGGGSWWQRSCSNGGPAQSQDENPREYVGRSLGDGPSYTCAAPEKTFRWHQRSGKGHFPLHLGDLTPWQQSRCFSENSLHFFRGLPRTSFICCCFRCCTIWRCKNPPTCPATSFPAYFMALFWS